MHIKVYTSYFFCHSLEKYTQNTRAKLRAWMMILLDCYEMYRAQERHQETYIYNRSKFSFLYFSLEDQILTKNKTENINMLAEMQWTNLHSVEVNRMVFQHSSGHDASVPQLSLTLHTSSRSI